MTIDLRAGAWENVLSDVDCDALISDPPYSKRTHDGMRVGDVEIDGREVAREAVPYASWSADDVHAFCASWAPRTRGWFVAITDHVLFPHFEDALLAAGRYVFQPIPFLEIGKQPRMTGDGPASWSCWIVAARPSCLPYSRWGSLPGGYVPPPHVVGNRGERLIKGGKPLWLMQALVRDYTRPGELVCDPCAGAATTLIAADIEHRRAVGSEAKPEHVQIAMRRIARGYTPTLFAD